VKQLILNPTGRSGPDQQRVLLYLFLVMVISFCLLCRTAFIQISQTEYFRLRSNQNHIQVELIPTQRGLILDCHGEVVARDRTSLTAVINDSRKSIREVAQTLNAMATLTGVAPELLLNNYTTARRQVRPFQAKPVLTDLTPQQLAHLETFASEVPGVSIVVSFKRQYFFPTVTSHLIGYMNELTPAEYQAWKDQGYRLGDWCGRTGVERLAEDHLHGNNGFRWIEVDARQQRIQALSQPVPIPPERGDRVYLNLDLRLQQAAARAFPPDRNGAVVALDPRNGKIRVLFSQPGYDPNAFIEQQASIVEHYYSSGRKYLLNRAIAGQYPAGSTFKVIDSLAALAEGSADASTHFSCNGAYRVGNAVFHCWKTGGHGNLDLIEALTNSCNVYFYQLALKIGSEPITRIARSLGLGQTTHISLLGEASGLIPDPAWKEQAGERLGLDRQWRPGDTANLAIGQGAVLVTPLQMATVIGAVANNGVSYRPEIIDRIIRSDGQVVFQSTTEVENRLTLPESVWATLRQGLEEVVTSGTGRRAIIYPSGVMLSHFPAGKTGTAQVGDRNNNGITEPEEVAHAWFIGYWPATEPELAIAVFVENGGGGGAIAAPIAREIFAVLDKERS